VRISDEFKPKETIDNPSDNELRDWALEGGGVITSFGNLAVFTKVKSRIAKFTQVYIEQELNSDEKQILTGVQDYLKSKKMIKLDRVMCTSPEFKTNCRLYVSAEYARLPLMWGNTLFPSEGKEPDSVTICIPEWEEKRVLVFPERGLTIALGSDYKGEIKKSMLRQMMYWAKKENSLGLHAASKIIRVYRDGKLRDFGCLLFGLSGTGKTTLSGHSHWLRFPEEVAIRQDDVTILKPDGQCIGTEDSFYIKTDGLESKNQPLLYAAAISRRAILENVKVNAGGEVDFLDSSITSNGRAMVKRCDIAYTDEKIDMDKLDFVFFITRRCDVQPPVARLTPEWGAAAFMLGESVETSAGDPSEAGKSVRVVGTNPFIIGSACQEGNMFLDFLRRNPHIQCFVLNTGCIGGLERGQKIQITDTVKIMEMIVRDEVTWERDSFWGYDVPVDIPGVNLEHFRPENFYPREKATEVSRELKQERIDWLSQFSDLKPEIMDVLKQ
jgi:phosphoenolpyruvate carboxykinase (ATP)